MKTSESIKTISAALLMAQKLIGYAEKGAINPFFKSTYADLGSVIEACKDALNGNGITVLQPVQMGPNNESYIETILLHSSGEWMSSEMKITVKAQNDPQAQGSAITYARRYSLQSFLNIPAEDDDGAKVTPKPEAKSVVNSVKATKPVAQNVVTAGTLVSTFIPTDVTAEAKVKKDGKKYTKYTIISPKGDKYTTVIKDIATKATDAKDLGAEVTVTYEDTQYGLSITGLTTEVSDAIDTSELITKQ